MVFLYPNLPFGYNSSMIGSGYYVRFFKIPITIPTHSLEVHRLFPYQYPLNHK